MFSLAFANSTFPRSRMISENSLDNKDKIWTSSWKLKLSMFRMQRKLTFLTARAIYLLRNLVAEIFLLGSYSLGCRITRLKGSGRSRAELGSWAAFAEMPQGVRCTKKGQEEKTEQESTPALQNFKAINVFEYIFPLLNVSSIDRLHEASQAFPSRDIPISKNHFISLALLANHSHCSTYKSQVTIGTNLSTCGSHNKKILQNYNLLFLWQFSSTDFSSSICVLSFQLRPNHSLSFPV